MGLKNKPPRKLNPILYLHFAVVIICSVMRDYQVYQVTRAAKKWL